tara:strand:+ start:396 stop:1415 length:1020 start_codon:yes stop_codon:yes gene_type:complete
MSGIIGKNSTRSSGAIGTSNIGADAVDSANIADDAIDSEHYTDGSIDNAHIADDAIDSEHYADGSIDNAHIADDAIDSEHYADGSIDNAHIADNAIDSEHYADGSIDTAHIATNQIDETLMKDAFVGDFTDATVTSSDYLLHGDATDSGNTKKDTVQGVLDLAVTAAVGKQTIWVPALAMYPTTNNGCAALAQVNISDQKPEVKSLDFDASTDEYAQFAVVFPKSWNEGTVTFRTYWTVTGTNTGTVCFQVAGVAVSSDDPFGATFGTQVANTALAASGTANDLMVNVESGAVTIGGSPAVGDQIFFQINRDISADDQTADARLVGIKLFFTTNAQNDD